MQIFWGVRAYKSVMSNSTDEICENAIETARAKLGLAENDIVVLTAGIPSPHVGGMDFGVSNMMRIVTIR